MEGTAVGYEINIYQKNLEMLDIKSSDDLFNAVKEILDSFDQWVIGIPADLIFEDDEYNKIEHHQEIISDFINPEKGIIAVVHHYDATDATYRFEYSDKNSPIKSKGMRFQGMTVVDTDSDYFFSKGKEIIYLELQGTGDAPVEETVLFWIDNGDQKRSASIEHYISSGLSEEQEVELREFTDEVFLEIFGNNS